MRGQILQSPSEIVIDISVKDYLRLITNTTDINEIRVFKEKRHSGELAISNINQHTKMTIINRKTHRCG